MKTKLSAHLILVSLFCFQFGSVKAQTVVRSVPLSRSIPNSEVILTTKTAAVAIDEAMPNAAKAIDATPENAEESADQKKLKLLLKEKFDRTTSSVLKEWSTDLDAERKAAKKKPPTFTAIVMNAFEGLAVFKFDKTQNFEPNDVVLIRLNEQDFGRWKLLSIDGQKVSAQKVIAQLPASAKSKSPKRDNSDNTVKTKPEVSTNEIQQDSSLSEQEQAPGTPTKSENTTEDDRTEKAKSLKAGDKIVVTNAKTLNEKPDANKQIELEVKTFARDVVLGNWDQVKTFLSEFKEVDADKIYAHLLKSLATAPKKPNAQPIRGQQPARPHLSPDDILQIADASPASIHVQSKKDESKDEPESAEPSTVPGLPAGVTLPPGVSIESLPPDTLEAIAAQAGAQPIAAKSSTAKANHISALAVLMRNAKTTGHDFTEFHKAIQTGTRHFGGDDSLKRLTAADLFLKAGMTEFVEEFLPELELAETKTNLPALRIWSQLALAMHSQKRVAVWLEKAWQINQWILGIEDIEKTDKELALSNLISLSSKIDKEVGIEWMNDSFTELPARGMTILTNLGTKSAEMALQAAQTAESTRLDLLRLQNEAVEKLIQISPEQASDWKRALTLLAQNWLTEAATSLKHSQQNGGREYMEIDMFGNYYWVNSAQRQRMYGGNNRKPRPIKIGDVLEIAPSLEWQNLVAPTLHTNLRQTKAKLHMRINEEGKAFPYIEEIAQSNPDLARDLIHEFLRIWTQNHDPNSSKRQRNPYIYFYGFDQKAEAIPLTRSKQERNLEELQGWVDRIRKLPIEDIEEKRLADAFTTCHSSAEVFKLNRFRKVFGDLQKLKPETIAAICEKMRSNLASNWRDIRNQEQKRTKRREPEVQKDVLEGYQTGLQLCEEAMTGAPDNWKLHLVKAKLMHDQNAYSQSVQKSSEFSDRRDAAFGQFENAAKKYAAVVTTLEQKDQSTDVFDFWFYASLGAVDLGKITDKTVPDLRQYAKIRSAIESLSPELTESHMAKFANNLFTRMSPIKPEIKFRYLRGGFQIAGDHPRAWEAKNLFDYYQDLVSEIKLVVEIDGADQVGSNQPFGAYVNILHTNEIERESGGFGKYVQNQNAMMYAFNYGRPTENYRDKFSDSVEMALGEHFEVQNITFQAADSMKSRPGDKLGWRVTPYAYVLLKPAGPEVDRIAPLKLDLDFLDTSGYVVIPIESPALVVDCSADEAPLRPVSDLEITQTLDERQADDGKLIVEISASAKGLVPDLTEIIEIERDNFELVSIDDQGVLPTSFDKEAEGIQILSDRSWTVEYKATESDDAIIDFAFSDPKLNEATSKFQRYEDADLVEVAKSVKLEKNYKASSFAFLYWLVPILAVGLFGLAGLLFIANQPQEVTKKRFEVPHDVNPFTVLTLLKDIKARNGISTEQGIDLQNSIDRIEKYYFGDDEDNRPDDLKELAVTWVRQAK